MLSGVIADVGMVTMSYAMAWGFAGPVTALVATETIWATLLNLLIYGQMPNWVQWLALALGTGGAVVISISEGEWCTAEPVNELEQSLLESK